MIGPWLFRLAGDLSEERAARVRSQERADMAAHLHDSVLQTLALIQKHASDPRAVSTLARAQERDLRSWLYGEQIPPDTSWPAPCVPRPPRSRTRTASPSRWSPSATRAWASGCGRSCSPRARRWSTRRSTPALRRVDVYAEVGRGRRRCSCATVATGSTESEVPADRLGVRHSIVDRMRRHGGTAVIRTAPGRAPRCGCP